MKLDRLCEARRNYSVWCVLDARRFVKNLKYALRPGKSLMKDRIRAGEALKRLIHEEHGRHKGHEFTGCTTAPIPKAASSSIIGVTIPLIRLPFKDCLNNRELSLVNLWISYSSIPKAFTIRLP